MSLFGFTAYRYINLRRLTHRRPMRILYLNHVLIWFYSRSLYTLETPDTQASNENLLFKSCDLYSLLLLVELLYRPVLRYQPSLSLQSCFERATRLFISKQSPAQGPSLFLYDFRISVYRVLVFSFPLSPKF